MQVRRHQNEDIRMNLEYIQKHMNKSMLLVLDLIKKNKIDTAYAEWISNKFESLFNTHKQ